MSFTLGKKDDIVIEFTSPSTREVDIHHKWVDYAISGIDMRIIVDSFKTSPDNTSHIIIGSREQRSENSEHCLSGERCVISGEIFQPSDLKILALQHFSMLYYKTVYFGNERVTKTSLKHLNLTAADFQSPSSLLKSIDDLWRSRNCS